MPYDVEILPSATPEEAKSAYIRFSRREQGEACVENMNDSTLNEKNLDVRPAWEKLFPVVIRGVPSSSETFPVVMELLKAKGLQPVDGDVLPGSGDLRPVVVRFRSVKEAQQALGALHNVQGKPVTLSQGWKDFTISLNNLPSDINEAALKHLVHLTSPYEASITGEGQAKISYFTRGEAEKAITQLCGSGIPDLKLRKVILCNSPAHHLKAGVVTLLYACVVQEWAVYRLHVKGLPQNVTEKDILEVLKG